MELNKEFLGYLDAFKTLNVDEKRNEVVRSVNELSAIIMYLADKESMNLEFLKGYQTAEFQNGLEKEDIFLDSLIVYIENAKNLVSQYLSNKI